MPGDRRKVDLTLTELGVDAIEAVCPTQRDVNDVLFSSLDEAAFATLSELTRGLLASAAPALQLLER